MTRALFSKKFHKLMAPRSEIIDFACRFKRKRNRSGIYADIFIGHPELSVAQINEQLPDMPNGLSAQSNLLHFGEDCGEEKGDRSFGLGGYMTCTLTDDPSKAIGCLRFRLSLIHRIRAQELFFFR